MAKFVNDSVLNTALNYIKRGNALYINSVDSTDYNDIIDANNTIAIADLSSSNYELKDFAGPEGGREIVVKPGQVTASRSGRFKQGALVDTTTREVIVIFSAQIERDIVQSDNVVIEHESIILFDPK